MDNVLFHKVHHPVPKPRNFVKVKAIKALAKPHQQLANKTLTNTKR